MKNLPRSALILALAIRAICGGFPVACSGAVFVTGHDPDFGAVSGNNVGAQHIIQEALNFTRNGNSAPILLIESSTSNNGLGDHLDSEQGLIASGYSAGNAPGDFYVKVNASQFATVNLSLYSSIFVPSDHGGSLTGDDLQALNARASDIFNYLKAGGGLVALAEDGFRTPSFSNPQPQNYGFLPFLITSIPKTEFEGGNTLTPFGESLGLTDSDVNGNFSHIVFTSTGGTTPVDFDASGEILSLAIGSHLRPSSAPEAASTLVLLASLAMPLLSMGCRFSRR